MSEGVPQFSTAEFANSGEVPCRVCGKSVSGAYYRINGQTACPNCTRALQEKFPKDSNAAFARGLIFGIGGAVAGLILYVVFTLATKMMIGFVSLAVGFIVARAMVFGSGGVRGRRYQLAAAILTYLAVSMSAVPIGIGFGHHLRIVPAILLGLGAPFLELVDPANGLIGLVILFVGLNIAWRLTAAPTLKVEGPLTPAAATQTPLAQ